MVCLNTGWSAIRIYLSLNGIVNTLHFHADPVAKRYCKYMQNHVFRTGQNYTSRSLAMPFPTWRQKHAFCTRFHPTDIERAPIISFGTSYKPVHGIVYLKYKQVYGIQSGHLNSALTKKIDLHQFD